MAWSDAARAAALEMRRKKIVAMNPKGEKGSYPRKLLAVQLQRMRKYEGRKVAQQALTKRIRNYGKTPPPQSLKTRMGGGLTESQRKEFRKR